MLRIPADGNVFYAINPRVDFDFVLRKRVTRKWANSKTKEVKTYLTRSLPLVLLHIHQGDKKPQLLDICSRMPVEHPDRWGWLSFWALLMFPSPTVLGVHFFGDSQDPTSCEQQLFSGSQTTAPGH